MPDSASGPAPGHDPGHHDVVGNLQFGPVSVASRQGRSEDMGLDVVPVSGRGLMACSLDPDEQPIESFVGLLKLKAMTGSSQQFEVKFDGFGVVSFGERRVFGVMNSGSAGGTRCAVDSRGSGTVLAFTIDRALAARYKTQEGGMLRKKIHTVVLVGDYWGLFVCATDRIGASGRTEKVGIDPLLSLVRTWVP